MICSALYFRKCHPGCHVETVKRQFGEVGDQLGGCCSIQQRDGDEVDRRVGGRERLSDLRYLLGYNQLVLLVDRMWVVRETRFKTMLHFWPEHMGQCWWN